MFQKEKEVRRSIILFVISLFICIGLLVYGLDYYYNITLKKEIITKPSVLDTLLKYCPIIPEKNIAVCAYNELDKKAYKLNDSPATVWSTQNILVSINPSSFINNLDKTFKLCVRLNSFDTTNFFSPKLIFAGGNPNIGISYYCSSEKILKDDLKEINFMSTVPMEDSPMVIAGGNKIYIDIYALNPESNTSKFENILSNNEKIQLMFKSEFAIIK